MLEVLIFTVFQRPLMNQLLRYGFIGIIFPLLVTYVFYFEFTSNYTQDLFSETKFRTFYSSNVYQTRPLGKELHLWTYQKLRSSGRFDKYSGSESYPAQRLKPMDREADALFYSSYFVLAALFTILTALLTLYTLEDPDLFPIAGPYKDLIVCFLILLIGSTQFVVTPYDTPGYFFEAGGILLFLRYRKRRSPVLLALLCLLIIAATLNRETSLLILSFMAAAYFSTARKPLDWIRPMLLPGICYALVYLYLKLFVGGGRFTDASTLQQNLNLRTPDALIGFLFAAFVVYFLIRLFPHHRKLVVSYLVFSLPYIVIIFLVGLTIEFRLWLPVLQGGIVLSLLSLDRLKTAPLKSGN